MEALPLRGSPGGSEAQVAMRTRSLILGAIVLVVATAISIFALRALTAPTNDVIDGVALATVVVSTRDIQANRGPDPTHRSGRIHGDRGPRFTPSWKGRSPM